MAWSQLFSAENLIRIFTLIGIYVILCVGLNLILGFTGLFSLGHVAFLAVGAYASASFVLYMHRAFPVLPGWLLFVDSIPVAAAAGLAAGLLIGVPCVRLRGDYLAIATLAFAEIVRLVAENIPCIGGSRGLPHGVAGLKWPDSVFYREYVMEHRVAVLVTVYAFVVLTILLVRNLMRSSHGRALAAIREDETAAALTGIHVTRYKVFAFGLSSALAGIGGALYVIHSPYFSPKSFNFELNIFMLLVVVLGGMGSLSGTVVAACVLTMARDFLKDNLADLMAGNTTFVFGRTMADWGAAVKEWWLVFYALLLILLMIFRPQGLFGKREIADTLLYRWFTGRLRGKKPERRPPSGRGGA